MKKSQVLAALALAFALGLGVVAPVANTYAVEARSIDGEAAPVYTSSSLQSAVNTITNNDAYKAYKAVAAADAKVKALTGTTTISDATSALQNAATTLGGSFTTGTNVTLEDQIGQAKAAVSNYATWEKLVNAINSDDATIKAQGEKAIMDKIVEAMHDLGYKNIKVEEGDVLKSVEANEDDGTQAKTGIIDEAKGLINADTKNNKYTYTQYAALVSAVQAATKVNDAFTSFKTALSNVNLKGIDQDEVKEAKTIANLSTAYAKLTGADKWLAVEGAVAAAENILKNPNTTSNAQYGQILDSTDTLDINGYNSKGLLQLMQAATGNTKLTVADLLAGSTTPSTPETPDTTTTITTPDNTVSVKGELQDGLVVKASEAEDKDGLFKKAFGDKKFFVYNIEVLDKDGNNVTTFDKNVTVTVKVPETIDGAKAGIYYVNDEGKAEKIASTYNAEAKTLTFTTNHFSFYAIVEDGGVNVGNNGVIAAADGTASSTVAIVAGIATALTAAGAGVVAYRNARRAGKEA